MKEETMKLFTDIVVQSLSFNYKGHRGGFHREYDRFVGTQEFAV